MRNLLVCLFAFCCYCLGFFVWLVFLLATFWLLLSNLPRLVFLMLCFLQQESFALTGCRTNLKRETKTNWEGIWVVLEENSFRQWKYRVFGGKERWYHAWTGKDGVKLHMREDRF